MRIVSIAAERPEIAVEVAALRNRVDVRAEQDWPERRVLPRRVAKMLPAASMRGFRPASRIRPMTYLPAGDVRFGIGDAADAVGERPARRTAEHTERFELLAQTSRRRCGEPRIARAAEAAATAAPLIDVAMV